MRLISSFTFGVMALSILADNPIVQTWYTSDPPPTRA